MIDWIGVRKSTARLLCVVGAAALLASACTGPQSTVNSRSDRTLATVEAADPTAPAATPTSEPDLDPSTAATATPTPTVDAADAVDASATEPETFDAMSHSLASALPTNAEFETIFGGGTWELDDAFVLVPGPTGQTTCEEPDPSFMDGINVKYQSIDHHQYVLVQLQRGEQADAWRDLVARFPSCGFGVVGTDIEIDGVDGGVVLSSDGPSPDGYWAVASASDGNNFVMVIGGGYAPDAATLGAPTLAALAAEILAST